MATREQVLDAIHGALREFRMEIPSLNSLDSAQMNSASLSCVNFAGAVLERVNPDPQDWPSSQYIYPSGLFLHVTVFGEPSSHNHGFCVFFERNVAYVIQAFLDHKVRLITPMDSHTFAISLGRLRSADLSEVAAAYKTISSVDISAIQFRVTDIRVSKA